MLYDMIQGVQSVRGFLLRMTYRMSSSQQLLSLPRLLVDLSSTLVKPSQLISQKIVLVAQLPKLSAMEWGMGGRHFLR